MKSVFQAMLALGLLLFSTTSLSAQKSAGIYYFNFTIDEALVSEVSVERKDRNFLSGWSTLEDIPEEMSEDIMKITEEALSEELKANVKCIYNKTKKGKQIVTNSMGGTDKVRLEGMPMVTFKQSASQHSKSLFIFVNAEVVKGGQGKMDWGFGKKFPPELVLQVKAYNSKKKVMWENKVKIAYQGGELKEKKAENKKKKVRRAETLKADDIYRMYELALIELTD
jgi:hypothetical protein